MENLYIDHPTEEALERFLLRQNAEEELDIVETHILACESCVARLETLEMQIAVTKSALEQLERESREKKPAAAFSKGWFAFPKLAWAGAAAALVLGIALVPQLRRGGREAVEVQLSAKRGVQNTVVPEGSPLHLRLETNDLPEGPGRVEIVDSNGAGVWAGGVAIQRGRIQVNVPGIKKAGTYFLRLYNPALLREFAFQVR
ncbi:MAG: hypothetical protein WB992_19535 [Bryobacteraceae bacterium]